MHRPRAVPFGLFALALIGILTGPARPASAQENTTEGATANTGAVAVDAEPSWWIRPYADFIRARNAFVDATEFDQRRTAFDDLLAELSSSLRERLYEPAPSELRRRVRMESFGSLMRHLDFLDFLHTVVADLTPHYADHARGAAALLADTGSPEALHTLRNARDGWVKDGRTRGALNLHIGRAVGLCSRRGPIDRSPELDWCIQSLEADLGHDDPTVRGGAIAGLFEAGESARALDALTSVLDGPAHLIDSRLATLHPLRRTFLRDDVDPTLIARTLALARADASDYVDHPPSTPPTTLSGIHPRVIRLRHAVELLRTLALVDHLPLLLECLQVPEGVAVLGLDGLQRLRLALQYVRRDVPPDLQVAIDDVFFSILYDTGERLFFLDEEPMDEDERRGYLSQRDTRYNAASYFTGVWDEDTVVRARWAGDVDALEFLSLLILADENESTGLGDDRLYTGVKDKLEARLQCARLLAMVHDVTDDAPTEPDLETYFLTLACQEMGIDPPGALASLQAWKALDAPHLVLYLEEVRPPQDDFVKVAALNGLGLCGYNVYLPDGTNVRIEREAAPAGTAPK